MIYRSPCPDIEIPDLPFTTVALRHADRLVDKPAFIDAPTGRTLTYGQLRRSIERAAAGFAALGVRQRDVITIFAPNSIEYIIAFHAITSLGAVVSPINPLSRTNELEGHLRRHNARFLITVPALVEMAEAASRDLPVQDLVIFGESARYPTFDVILACNEPMPVAHIDPQTDIAALLSSSGTTGLPKGVMLTHRNLTSMALASIGSGGIVETDIVPGQLPLFHMAGVNMTISAYLVAGATSVLMPRFDFEALLRLIQEYRATILNTSPPVMIQFAKNPLVDDYDLASLEVITSAAAPLGADIQNAVQQRLGCVLKQAYGSTEASPIICCPRTMPREKQGSVGLVVLNTEVRIVDPLSEADVSSGECGELWVRGPQVMAGYLSDTDATAAALDIDGWLHTGDLGYADEDGYFYIVDRLKELIKYKAYQVAPAELEALLLTHPTVADAAVVRYPDEDAGEVPKAFVVTRAPIDPDELMAWVAERVAPYKKIRLVEFIDVIPKSASGKILRRELIERDRSALVAPV
jgi:acyl-CoA synthetase (AMP-forming)/AMP-acid ligase II